VAAWHSATRAEIVLEVKTSPPYGPVSGSQERAPGLETGNFRFDVESRHAQSAAQATNHAGLRPSVDLKAESVVLATERIGALAAQREMA
jgi:hypothetical protein